MSSINFELISIPFFYPSEKDEIFLHLMLSLLPPLTPSPSLGPYLSSSNFIFLFTPLTLLLFAFGLRSRSLLVLFCGHSPSTLPVFAFLGLICIAHAKEAKALQNNNPFVSCVAYELFTTESYSGKLNPPPFYRTTF